jgi:hypothetical protein
MGIDDDSLGAIARQCLAAVRSSPPASGRKQLARHSSMPKSWNHVEPFDISNFLPASSLMSWRVESSAKAINEEASCTNKTASGSSSVPAKKAAISWPRSYAPSGQRSRLIASQAGASTISNCTDDHLGLPFPGNPAGFSWVRSRNAPRKPEARPTLESPNLSRSLSAALNASFQRCCRLPSSKSI